MLLPKASPWSFRERDEPFLEVSRVGLQPAVGIEGQRVREYIFGIVDEGSATANDGLMVVSRLHFPRDLIDRIRTKAGTCAPSILAPEAGTILRSGEATPGLMRRDSLITAVCYPS